MYSRTGDRTGDPRISVPMPYRLSFQPATVTICPALLRFIPNVQVGWETYVHTFSCYLAQSWSHTGTKCHMVRKKNSRTGARIIIPTLYRDDDNEEDKREEEDEEEESLRSLNI